MSSTPPIRSTPLWGSSWVELALGFSARRGPRIVGTADDIGDQIARHLVRQKAGIVPGHRIADKVGKRIDPPSLPYPIKRRPGQRWRLASTQVAGMTRPADGIERVLALQDVAGRHGPAGAERKLFRGLRRSCRSGGDDESNAPRERTHPNLVHYPPRLLIQPFRRNCFRRGAVSTVADVSGFHAALASISRQGMI